MKPYVIYLRRSTSDESHQQYSLDAQEKICRKYVEQHGLPVTKVLREQHSAKEAGKRPLFLQMLTDLEEGKYAGAVVHNVDRLLRSIGDFALIDSLRNKGVELHFVDGSYPNTPEGNMMLGINVVFAKWYVEKLGKEVKKGFKESLSQGRYPGMSPVGYKDVGHGLKEVDDRMASLVQQAFALYDSGKYSLTELTKEMQSRGLRTKRGTKYGTDLPKSSMHRILTNPFYYGLIRFKGNEYQGVHVPLIKEELFKRVQERLIGRRHTSIRQTPYAFRGLVTCHCCGKKISPYTKKGLVYYGCTDKECRQSTTREEVLDEHVSRAADLFVYSDEEMSKVRASLSSLEDVLKEERDKKVVKIESGREVLRSDLDTARKMVIDGVFNKSDFEAEKKRISEELSELMEEEDELNKYDVQRLEDLYTFLELCRTAYASYKDASPEKKNGLAKLAFLELSIEDKQIASSRLKPEFQLIGKRSEVLYGGVDGTRTRDLLRDREAL